MELNNTAKMAQILAELRRQTNGAVTGAMEERGVVWPLNYGVSVPAIRRIAARYAPDHALGKLLYRQQVRELRLAGIMMADPGAVSADEMPFWAEGVVNTEVAEHLSFLLARSGVLDAIAEACLGSDNEWLRYAAMLSVTRRITSGASDAGPYARIALDSCRAQLSADSRPLWHACAAFLNALYRVSPVHRSDIDRLAAELSESEEIGAAYAFDELWLDHGE